MTNGHSHPRPHPPCSTRESSADPTSTREGLYHLSTERPCLVPIREGRSHPRTAPPSLAPSPGGRRHPSIAPPSLVAVRERSRHRSTVPPCLAPSREGGINHTRTREDLCHPSTALPCPAPSRERSTNRAQPLTRRSRASMGSTRPRSRVPCDTVTLFRGSRP